MRKKAVGFAAVVVGLLAVGPVFAGSFGSDAPPARIPIPAHDYAAVVEDQSGTRVDVTQVSYNGEVFIYGNLGQGQITVPFDTIKEVRFEPSTETGKRIAFVTLKDGQSVKLIVEFDVPAYGKTAFGSYSIEVDKISRISFK